MINISFLWDRRCVGGLCDSRKVLGSVLSKWSCDDLLTFQGATGLMHRNGKHNHIDLSDVGILAPVLFSVTT